MRRADILLALCLAAMPATGHAQRDRVTGDSVIDEINFVRADPQAYADELRAYRELYQGNSVIFPDQDNGLRTYEGVSAVDEAIRFLERQPALPPLKRSALLDGSAGDHVRDQGRSGRVGHIGSDGLNPGQRLKRRGGDIYMTESLTYGPETATDAVRQLIIDDNVKGRGHRKMLFSPRWNYAGAVCGPHPNYRRMCAIDLAERADGTAQGPPRGD
ncbi:CAP domain-containing protein [Sphingobium boeckii]|uniref:Uncharacterized protein YkwD n=1 Tax=Sphingobium boeckii TaxID=1082345 RepID=A0A7W9AFN9_9SPHN|nr:CAP domain-containing protein [Sphingobium boeckii]MBB5684586.1 uncharacterized protein YkwD [Sphingobium boeckii]